MSTLQDDLQSSLLKDACEMIKADFFRFGIPLKDHQITKVKNKASLIISQFLCENELYTNYEFLRKKFKNYLIDKLSSCQYFMQILITIHRQQYKIYPIVHNYDYHYEKIPCDNYNEVDIQLRRLNSLAYILSPAPRISVTLTIVNNGQDNGKLIIGTNIYEGHSRQQELLNKINERVSLLRALVWLTQNFVAVIEKDISYRLLLPLFVRTIINDYFQEYMLYDNYLHKIGVKRRLIKLIYSIAKLYIKGIDQDTDKNFDDHVIRSILEQDPLILSTSKEAREQSTAQQVQTDTKILLFKHSEICLKEYLESEGYTGIFKTGGNFAACTDCDQRLSRQSIGVHLLYAGVKSSERAVFNYPDSESDVEPDTYSPFTF